MSASQTSAKPNFARFIIDQISGVFMPIINVVMAAGILKGTMILLNNTGILADTSGVYRFLYACSDGLFFFLPFFLAVSASKKWKADPFISMLIPAAMLYPDLVAAYEAKTEITFFGIPALPAVYHSSVIPILLSIALLPVLEKPCDKYLPKSIHGFMKPILCCLVLLPATFLVFGPLGTLIGDAMTGAFGWLYDRSPVAAGAFMGFVMQPMVVVGAHWSVVPISIANITRDGYDTIMPLVGAAVYAQAGAAFAVATLYKNKKKRQSAVNAGVTAVLGVTESCLYGVNIPLVLPMLAACTAGSIGGAIVGMVQAHCNSFAFPSFLTCVAYVGPGFVVFLLSMVLGLVLSFIFTILMRKPILKRIAQIEANESEGQDDPAEEKNASKA
ncbi:MAG: PTS transporter subunit EIIC [Lachnospiraceae bacterium]|nr:PTS transporter subunit EIIC [Lachnospiraceae bacterium]